MTKLDLIIFDCDGVWSIVVLSCRCLSQTLAGYGINLGLDQALDLFMDNVTAVLNTAKRWDADSGTRPSCTAGFVPVFTARFARLKA
jgi:hypothetical protein